jgi:tetratricopeptide (TPR) repeat protein
MGASQETGSAPPALVLVSTTLTGNSESVIADALRSVVDWVDLCLVIDTGVTDRTLEIARQIAGSKYREQRFQWRNDFSAARNFALDAAREVGATWSLTLDTDERVELHGENLRDLCLQTQAGVIMMPDSGRTYSKERLFRLPCPVRFEGPTHESFAGYVVGTVTTAQATFAELPKSAEALERKFRRDREILIAHTKAHPTDARWHYYLGDTHRNLRELEPAVAAYDRCASLRGWDEESAWACYRAAECLTELGRFQEALDRCTAGMARHAGLAELPWMAGFCAYSTGNFPQCVYWARLATTYGLFKGHGAQVPRIGFRHPPALYEGPYDLLRFALANIGDAQGAAEAGELYRQAVYARTGRAP